uniref:Peptidase n=1 Tax=viral metagenome TaxID=1070528 RepID=A0A6M3JAJ8_9ZZZZ
MAIHPLPGDVLLVARRPTLRSFLAGPTGWFVSWRIRRRTGKAWNHVATFSSASTVVEADGTAVVQRPIVEYLAAPWKFRLGIVRMPDHPGLPYTSAATVNREAASAFVRGQLGARYDRRTVLALWFASVLWGPDGIRRVVQSSDGGWICSELAVGAWAAGHVSGATAEAYPCPGSFADRHPVHEVAGSL